MSTVLMISTVALVADVAVSWSWVQTFQGLIGGLATLAAAAIAYSAVQAQIRTQRQQFRTSSKQQKQASRVLLPLDLAEICNVCEKNSRKGDTILFPDRDALHRFATFAKFASQYEARIMLALISRLQVAFARSRPNKNVSENGKVADTVNKLDWNYLHICFGQLLEHSREGQNFKLKLPDIDYSVQTASFDPHSDLRKKNLSESEWRRIQEDHRCFIADLKRRISINTSEDRT